MDIGQSFSPTQAQNQMGGNGAQMRSAANPVMDAIKILSFRVPQTLGANAPVGAGLLAGPGGATPGLGGSDAALIQQWLQRFFGGGLNQAGSVAPNALPGFGSLGAPAGSGDPNAMGAGSSLPGAMPPPQPGRTSVQFPQANRGDIGDQMPPPSPVPTSSDWPMPAGMSGPQQTWGDLGGARRSIGPPAFTPSLGGGMGSDFANQV